MDRRTFLRTATGAAIAAGTCPLSIFPASAAINPRDVTYEPNEVLTSQGLLIRDALEILNKGEATNTAPVLREEILDNPNAVFIVYANVQSTKDSKGVWSPCNDQMQTLGRRIAELVFRKGTVQGGKTLMNNNLVAATSGTPPNWINGNNVHPYFTVGMADALHDLGNTNVAACARGALRHNNVVSSGLDALFKAHNLPLIEAHYQWFSDYTESELIWHENPEGTVVRRFCTYKPTFESDTTYINVAHAHTHPVGLLTLTTKNLQGIMPRIYGHVCDSWTTMDIWRKEFMDNFNPNYRSAIEQLYYKHANMGFQYWDDGDFVKTYTSMGGYDVFMKALEDYWGKEGAAQDAALNKLYDIADAKIFWGEQWAQRTMDMMKVIPDPYINMVEGVFAAQYGGSNIYHTDFITIGRSRIAVDAVTAWLMGHDPRGVPFLRIAKENGVGENNIEKIPVYILDENGPRKVDYTTLNRTYIGIYVYSLSNNRYFTEPVITSVEEEQTIPKAFITASCYPNPFNPVTTIQFELSQPGTVSLSVYTITGQRIHTVNLGQSGSGKHMYIFNASGLTSGVYMYRIQTENANISGKMVLMK